MERMRGCKRQSEVSLDHHEARSTTTLVQAAWSPVAAKVALELPSVM